MDPNIDPPLVFCRYLKKISTSISTLPRYPTDSGLESIQRPQRNIRNKKVFIWEGNLAEADRQKISR